MILVDSNILIDLFERDPLWWDWSRRQLAEAVASGPVAINSVVVAECAPRFASLDELRMYLGTLDVQIEDLPLEAAFHAGQVFRAYRRDGTGREKILADFLIGAHAQSLGATLLTRDKRIYARYFPQLSLRTPETDNG